MDSSIRKLTIVLVIPYLCPLIMNPICVTRDAISMDQQVVDGQTLVSAGGIFELGFFSPNGSRRQYVGIWYKGLPVEKVAWVANRERPLIGSYGVLRINASDGNLVLVDDKNMSVWSTDIDSVSNNTIAVLTDQGNLVLLDQNMLNDSVPLWESFNHPSDVLLPRMKIGINTRTGGQIVATSWKDEEDPSMGSFTTAVVDPHELLQVLILNGSLKHFRSGQWNRRSFIGVPSMTKDFHNGFQLLTNNNGEELYFSYAIVNYSAPTLIYFDSYGGIIQMDWDAEEKKWLRLQIVPKGQCDLYNTCGPFGSCKNDDSPICKCLRGYEPKSIDEWNEGNWTSGCVRRSQFQCEETVTSPNSDDERQKEDVFFQVSGMKLPDFSHYLLTWDKMECENSCLKNCSCLAYAYVDGIGCMIWGEELIDLQEFSHGGEQLYIRLAHSQLDKKRLTEAHIAIIVSATLGLILVVCTIYILKIRNKGIGSLIPSCITSKNSSAANLLHKSFTQGSSCSELPVFSFKCIETATKNFCFRNKLGEGGFGPVYKGVLANGQEVAIKRLSRSSGQGVEEFKNEVTLISGLQHRNLVKLMGFCIHGEEKLLIYEYMFNRSLDIFIFGSKSNDKVTLSWNQRYSIIEGIARGLLYLHRDSRLKIIHRDLKTSNILLDEDMNPKISDFGMARIFGGNQTIANTNRIAGTYGYMSPEYAIQGIFSEKSDVFSFGVILLEIISSKRNNSYCHSEDSLNLLDHAWKLWNEGKILEFSDEKMAYSLETSTQVVRCILVGLLCVQENACYRPNTATIVSMLCSDTALPLPKRPAYSNKDRTSDDPSCSPCSRNSMSISNVEGR